jgi:WD40 repeat protein
LTFNTIAIAGINGKMLIWDLIKNEKIRSTLGFFQMTDPSFKILVGWGHDDINPLKIFDFDTEKELHLLNNKTRIKILTIAFSPNEKILAGGGNEGVIIWNFETGEEIQKIDKFMNIKFHEHLDQVFSIVFSSDGCSLWTTGRDGIIQIWDINTGKNVGSLQGKNLISEIYMSNNGQTLIGVSGRQKIDVWSQ